MKRITIGILAHVDAGKTTLSEQILFQTNTIKKVGRVDHGDAYLDTKELERKRGITIFSKQAVVKLEDCEITILDTPGHVDFSAEMERTLDVLDYAILLVNASSGVQSHTRTLWRLLQEYQVPTFIFVNKMDQVGVDKNQLMEELQDKLGENCVDFLQEEGKSFYESLAMCEESILEEYLERGSVGIEGSKQGILNRTIVPCYFGAAINGDGVESFLEGLQKYSVSFLYEEEFGGRVFKISRDEKGNRLFHTKITSGVLRVRDEIKGYGKVTQLRIYSGEKYESVGEVEAGQVCVILGLDSIKSGAGLGVEEEREAPMLEPVLNFEVQVRSEQDLHTVLQKFLELEEEDPLMAVKWQEKNQRITVRLMGAIQQEILKELLKERYNIIVDFVPGDIIYKETVLEEVEGVGHFEPLRHYAEVHVIIRPLEPGSGVVIRNECQESRLSINWQKLILTHLAEKPYVGVLTGGEVTDVEFALVAGRGHDKHTEGGDFREATYRAVRHGLQKGKCGLLEPWYDFVLEVSNEQVGRAMMDIEKMNGRFGTPEQEGEFVVLKGSAPVATMSDYYLDVVSYTGGEGRLSLIYKGYEPCHNEEDVIARINYQVQEDVENPTGSIFCKQGAGYYVPWDEVEQHMHLENHLKQEKQEVHAEYDSAQEERYLGIEEIDRILEQTYGANKGRKKGKRQIRKKKIVASPGYQSSYTPPKKTAEKYLLVDGYNIVFAWEELKELARDNIDGARGRLLDILCDYQGSTKKTVIVVFDAYKVKGSMERVMDYHNIHVVFTKEAETADQYIEKFAYNHQKDYDITVATSDRMEQIIIQGKGCSLLSARELKVEVDEIGKRTKEYIDQMKK